MEIDLTEEEEEMFREAYDKLMELTDGEAFGGDSFQRFVGKVAARGLCDFVSCLKNHIDRVTPTNNAARYIETFKDKLEK